MFNHSKKIGWVFLFFYCFMFFFFDLFSVFKVSCVSSTIFFFSSEFIVQCTCLLEHFTETFWVNLFLIVLKYLPNISNLKLFEYFQNENKVHIMFSIHISKLVNIIRRIEYLFKAFIEIQILWTLRISISICRMLLRQKIVSI